MEESRKYGKEVDQKWRPALLPGYFLISNLKLICVYCKLTVSIL
ncbi:hypothetical protein HOLDEFILI_00860 [Holdemania filiformis DSM 12042]|uniref:Uncharacterized protein n=1 Tax=Holdemania filiformis DSM 12042 TaxID=545696 RepID=B9Y4X9_9FIRM|nr:hypothetical protein HOLDEFILI_00860 [Holdemania filiformis DSM 12042]